MKNKKFKVLAISCAVFIFAVVAPTGVSAQVRNVLKDSERGEASPARIPVKNLERSLNDRLEAIDKNAGERANKVREILDATREETRRKGEKATGALQKARDAALDARDAVKGLRDSALQEVKNVREGIREETGKGRELIKEQSEQARNSLREESKTARAELLERRETMRAELKQKTEEAKKAVQARKAELMEKVRIIRNENKRKIVEGLAEKLAGANEAATSRISEVLNKTEDIVERLSARADELESRGADVAAARNMIASARETIASARAAIAEQAGRSYSVADILTGESTLRNDLSALRSTLKKDLDALRVNYIEKAKANAKEIAILLKEAIDRIKVVPEPDAVE